MIGRLALFESPRTLAKTWNLDSDGNAKKAVAAQLSRGTYSVAEFADVDDLALVLNAITTRQAVSSSLPHDDSVSGYVTTKREMTPGAKVRCKSEFGLQSSPGFVFLDHDAADEAGAMSKDELWSRLTIALPALSTAGAVWRPSGSSHIFKGDHDLTGLRGQHVMVMIADASDGPRVIETIAARLWLAGMGKIHTSKAGSLLVRCPIDTAPSDAARLIFSGAECGPGLEQRRGPPVVISRGGFLDSCALVPDLTSEELGRYEALVEQAKAAAAPEAARKRAEHRGTVIASRLPEMMKRGMSASEAEQKIGAAVDAAFGGTLLAEFELTAVHDDGRKEAVTVESVLTDRDRWNEVDVLDPINPSHRGGSPDCRLFLHGTSPVAYSFDGCLLYRLRNAQQKLVVAKGSRGELVNQIAAAISDDTRVFSTEAGPVMVANGKMLTLTVDRLMNLIGTELVLVVKTAKGETPTDVTREVAGLVLAALSTATRMAA